MEDQDKADALAELHQLLMAYYNHDADEVFPFYLTILYSFVDMKDIATVLSVVMADNEDE